MPVIVEGFRVPAKPAAGVIVVTTTVLSWLGHSRFSFSPRGGLPPGG
jgi:hypothetical protein